MIILRQREFASKVLQNYRLMRGMRWVGEHPETRSLPNSLSPNEAVKEFQKKGRDLIKEDYIESKDAVKEYKSPVNRSITKKVKGKEKRNLTPKGIKRIIKGEHNVELRSGFANKDLVKNK